MKLSKTLSIITVVPVSLAVICAFFWSTAVNEKIDFAKRSQQVVALSNVLDNVAHQFAVERGLTAGFLGSGGAQGKDKVIVQRGKADEAANALISLKADTYPDIDKAIFDDATGPVIRMFDGRAALRKRVDEVDKGAPAFAYYSELNATTLASIDRIGLLISDSELKSQFYSRLALLRAKERAGQSRGALNGIFAAGKTNASRHASVSMYLDEEKSELNWFQRLMPAEQAKKLTALESQPHWQQVASASKGFVGSQNFDQISGPNNWFALATQRIGDIKGLSDELGESITQGADAIKSQLVWQRNSLLMLFVLIIVPLGLLLLKLQTSLTRRVNRIQQALVLAAKEKNLTSRLNDTSEDEIGLISHALDNHFQHMQSVFSEMRKLVEVTDKQLDEVTDLATQALNNASAQHSQTDQIATAMTEMSQTSAEIATNMQQSASETEILQTQGKEGRSRIDAGEESVRQLDAEIDKSYEIVKELSDNTHAISGLLATIEGIAQQTNLLALNAAIEAARAGEQGRGFAVVADEVRSLSQRTQASTEEIQGMISKLRKSSDHAMKSMSNSKEMTDVTTDLVVKNAEMVETIFASIDRLNMVISQVATAAEEQTHVSDDINRNVHDVASLSDQTLNSVEQSNKTVKDIRRGFESLMMQIESYKL
ncbi:MAG: methyl-accepting chemotaxis protein [Hahellaceae bacterium]|jgi:methyl-accepting chemotaxis protein|nr:methyl-accepting chemotaxis protein [Hahellaceae bacterium]